VRSLQTGVSEAIHNSEDDELMLVDETLLLVLHVLRHANSYRRALTTCMVDPLSKHERNRTDGSRDMPVQSYRSVPTALVDCSDPADSCAKTMTWRDVGNSLATQGHPEFPVNPKISENCGWRVARRSLAQLGRSRSTLELVQHRCVCFKRADTGKRNII
jgi:hypothetical protein